MTVTAGFDDVQKATKDNFDITVRSFGEMNRGFSAIAVEVSDFTKKAFEDGTKTFEKLIGARSLEQVVDIQTTYAKKSYEEYVAQMSKLGEMYVGLAKDAYRPFEQVAARVS